MSDNDLTGTTNNSNPDPQETSGADELTSALGALKGLLAEQGVNLGEDEASQDQASYNSDEDIPTLSPSTAATTKDDDIPLLSDSVPDSGEDDIPTLSPATEAAKPASAPEDDDIPLLSASVADSGEDDIPTLSPATEAAKPASAAEDDDIPLLSASVTDEDEIPTLSSSSPASVTAAPRAESDEDIPLLSTPPQSTSTESVSDELPTLEPQVSTVAPISDNGSDDDLDLDAMLEQHANENGAGAGSAELDDMCDEILEEFGNRIDAVLTQTRRKLLSQLEAELEIMKQKLSK